MTAKQAKKVTVPRQRLDPLLVSDSEYLPVLMKTLDTAKSTIDIVAFSFGIGSVAGNFRPSAPLDLARRIAELKRKRPKVKIRLFLEGKRETAERNRVTGNFLKEAGVQIKYGSTHAKGFMVDGRYVLFGSTNLTNQSIKKNYETNLFIDDPSVATEFSRYFEHLWSGGMHGGIHLNPPLYADGDFREPLLEMIETAKTRIEFSIYFFHHSEIEQAFIRAAKRGVKVTGFFHHHESFALSYVRRTRGTALRMKASGVKEIHFGPSNLFSHSKYLIRDRKEVLLGTGNWLHEDIKIHPQLYIRFSNSIVSRKLATRLGKQIAKDMIAHEK